MSIALLIVEKPKTTINDKQYNIILRKNVPINETLRCIVSGTPEPKVTWKRRGIELHRENSRFVLTGSNLHIYNVEEDDAGIYTCEAVNKAGKSVSDVYVRTFVPPKIIETDIEGPSVSKESKIGSFYKFYYNNWMQLVCRASGKPTPRINWYHNGSKVSLDNSVDGSSSYVKYQMTFSDAGVYECQATNDVASAKTEVAKIQILAAPQIVHVLQSDGPVTESSTVTLTCLIKGSYTNILWIKNTHKLVPDNRVLDFKNGTLIIHNARKRDAGLYTCIASNPGGNAEGRVAVQVWSKPYFVQEPSDMAIAAGDNIMLQCQAKGLPPPIISWLMNDESLKQTERHVIHSNGSLSILVGQVTDSGTYTCVAKNNLGASESHKAGIKVYMHGEYSAWSPWTNCSVSCGQGVRVRLRKCDSPPPANGGRWCIGQSQDLQRCVLAFCPVDAQWNSWQMWEPCPVSCGIGTQIRQRRCDNPPVQNGGKPCQGHPIQLRPCGGNECPVNGRWSQWESWSACDKTCGLLTNQIRKRYCNNPPPAHKGEACPGSDWDRRDCPNIPKACETAAVWSVWSLWGTCSVSCNGGQRFRERKCQTMVNGVTKTLNPGRCNGNQIDEKEIEECGKQACPKHGVLENWSEWSRCSATCDGGSQQRTRVCIEPQNGGRPCRDEKTQKRMCNIVPCTYTNWNSWSKCSGECGQGTRSRHRYCKVKENCKESDLSQIQVCQGLCESNDNITGTLEGNLNGFSFGRSTLRGSYRIINKTAKYHISAENNIMPLVGKCLKLIATAIMSPVLWANAFEVDKATNGMSVVKGQFIRKTDILFQTLHRISLLHYSNISSNGNLVVYIKVDGNCPEFDVDNVRIPTYQNELYTKLNPSMKPQLSISSVYTYNIKRSNLDVPAYLNATIEYPINGATQMYINQLLFITDIEAEFKIAQQTLIFNGSSKITKSNVECNKGLQMHNSRKFCEDMNECVSDRTHNCQQLCINTFASYLCACKSGYVLDEDDRSCKDVDECASGLHSCRQPNQKCVNYYGGYKCENIRDTSNTCSQRGQKCPGECVDDSDTGRYRCVCPSGYEYKETSNQCADINECVIQRKCAFDQQCLNTLGSYECRVIRCPRGYEYENRQRICTRYCTPGKENCPSSGNYTDHLKFIMINALPKYPDFKLKIIDSKNTDVRNCFYTLLDKSSDTPFNIRTSNGKVRITRTTNDLRDKLGKTFDMKIRAFCYKSQRKLQLIYQNTFSVFIHISKHNYGSGPTLRFLIPRN